MRGAIVCMNATSGDGQSHVGDRVSISSSIDKTGPKLIFTRGVDACYAQHHDVGV
jgi:hypothetical protein